MKKPPPNTSRMKELLDYNSDFGIFIWKKANSKRIKVGTIAGNLKIEKNGHRRVAIGIDGIRYYAHNLAWLYIYGEWPPEEIDHINGNGADNRILNLRLCNRFGNTQNSRMKKNALGVKGVYLDKRRGTFVARIMCNKKYIHLGEFKTLEEAKNAYIVASPKYHGEFSRVA